MNAQRPSIRPIRSQGLKRVYYRNQARTKWYCLRPKAAWVTPSIPAFVMMQDQLSDVRQTRVATPQDVCTSLRVILDSLELLRAKTSGPAQHTAWDSNLAYVMKHCGPVDGLSIGWRNTKDTRQSRRQPRDPLRMLLCRTISCRHSVCQCPEDGQLCSAMPSCNSGSGA